MSADPTPGASADERTNVRIEAEGTDVDRASEVLGGSYSGTGWSVTPTAEPFSFRYAALGDEAVTFRASQMRGTTLGGNPGTGDYVVQWLVGGSAVMDLEREAVAMQCGVPMLAPAYRPFVFSFTDFDQRLVHLNRDHVDRIAREQGLRGALRLDHRRAVDAAAVARWHAAVGDTAGHLGRFSAAYAARVGEYPCETLAR